MGSAFAGWGKSKCGDPNVGECLESSRKSKAICVLGTEWVKKTVNMRPERKDRTDFERLCNPLQGFSFTLREIQTNWEFCAAEWQDLTHSSEHYCGHWIERWLCKNRRAYKEAIEITQATNDDDW